MLSSIIFILSSYSSLKYPNFWDKGLYNSKSARKYSNIFKRVIGDESTYLAELSNSANFSSKNNTKLMFNICGMARGVFEKMRIAGIEFWECRIT